MNCFVAILLLHKVMGAVNIVSLHLSIMSGSVISFHNEI